MTQYGVTHFVQKASEAMKRDMIKHGTPVCEWVPVVSEEVVGLGMRRGDFVEAYNPRAAQAVREGWGDLDHALQMNENATGKHTSRNHRVRVPTRAGEPVRR